MATVGYIRVSSVDQNTERQLDGVALDKVFEDKCSGKDTQRPALQQMLDYVRDGDQIIVHDISRLARNLEDLLGLVKNLTAKGVAVRFNKENLLFTGEASPMQELMLSMLGAVYQFERSMILERQREAVVARGGEFGAGRHHGLAQRVLLCPALQRRDAVLGRDRGAVVELQARTQGEGPGLAVV